MSYPQDPWPEDNNYLLAFVIFLLVMAFGYNLAIAWVEWWTR